MGRGGEDEYNKVDLKAAFPADGDVAKVRGRLCGAEAAERRLTFPAISALARSARRAQPRVHWLPVHLDHDGPARVSTFYAVRKSAKGLPLAQFRGREFYGAVQHLPEPYQLLVYGEAAASLAARGSDTVRERTVRGATDHVMYWNHDVEPSAADAVAQSLDWLTTSMVLHGKATAEEALAMRKRMRERNEAWTYTPPPLKAELKGNRSIGKRDDGPLSDDEQDRIEDVKPEGSGKAENADEDTDADADAGEDAGEAEAAAPAKPATPKASPAASPARKRRPSSAASTPTRASPRKRARKDA